MRERLNAFLPRLSHRAVLVCATLWLLAMLDPVHGALGVESISAPRRYAALALAGKAGVKVINRYGVPFVPGSMEWSKDGSSRVEIGCPVKRIFLLGMTESAAVGCWADPTNYFVRYFVGDESGQIRLNYADGSNEIFPLILGENIWWGLPFYRCPEPYPSDARFRKALAAALRLYPPAPVKDGNYVAVIAPKPVALQSITISRSPAKQGTPMIAGITVELAGTNGIAGSTAVSPGAFAPGFSEFVRRKRLLPLGAEEKQTQRRLKALRLAFYSNDKVFSRASVASATPRDYTGPAVSFKGCIPAKVLADAFKFNLQDMSDKIDSKGMYHTSSKGAALWGYWGRNDAQFGTYTTNVGLYYRSSWSRDMGRSLQELTELGYTNDAVRCADYCLRMARQWNGKSAPHIHGKPYPPHWSRVANGIQGAPPFENDGHGLITLFLYKLWQRLPNRDAWLRARWPDVKAAGDWILWQFEHPQLSGATNGVLHTTGECAAGNGYSVFADCICMNALRALAHMADSIGQFQSARQWRERAAEMQKAITAQYIVTDPRYGRVWTLVDAGWPNKSTVLGPLISRADFQGFAPQKKDSPWRMVNEAAYQRLIDTYRPFGFYGWAMGYGQGFVTQSALLLDRMHDATRMLEWAAKEIYDPRLRSYIVPEGVQIDPTGRFWYRAGDLGNGVQEAEIIKTLRLVIGVDDTRPEHIRIFPRMPYGWTEMQVAKYPILLEREAKRKTGLVRYRLVRRGRRMRFEIACNQDLGPVPIRLGPFENRPDASAVEVNGKDPTITAERSGDSWWARFTVPIGPEAGAPGFSK